MVSVTCQMLHDDWAETDVVAVTLRVKQEGGDNGGPAHWSAPGPRAGLIRPRSCHHKYSRGHTQSCARAE